MDISNSLEIVYSVGADGALEVDEAFLTKKMDQCARRDLHANTADQHFDPGLKGSLCFMAIKSVVESIKSGKTFQTLSFDTAAQADVSRGNPAHMLGRQGSDV